MKKILALMVSSAMLLGAFPLLPIRADAAGEPMRFFFYKTIDINITMCYNQIVSVY